jgi:hypothetical protein
MRIVKTRLASSTALIIAVLLSPLSLACPDCPKGIQEQVRAGIFDDTFAENAVMAALPFGVLAAITAAVHAGLPKRRRRHG